MNGAPRHNRRHHLHLIRPARSNAPACRPRRLRRRARARTGRNAGVDGVRPYSRDLEVCISVVGAVAGAELVIPTMNEE
jgi:hypothetical protein